MNTAVTLAPTTKTLWIGRVLGALPALLMLGSAAAKLSHAPGFVAKWTDTLGWPEAILSAIGAVELASVVLFLVPRTRFVGALLLTAYLGGAVAAHVRIGDAFAAPVVLGVLVWASLVLREPRVRELVVSRRTA